MHIVSDATIYFDNVKKVKDSDTINIKIESNWPALNFFNVPEGEYYSLQFLFGQNTEIYLDKSYSTAVLNLSINDDASEPAFEFQLNGVKNFDFDVSSYNGAHDISDVSCESVVKNGDYISERFVFIKMMRLLI